MRRKLLPIVALAMVGLVGVVLIGSDAAGRNGSQPSIRIVFVRQVEPRGREPIFRAHADRAGIATLRKELSADPALVRKLRARGFQMRNVIGREKSFDGGTIVYVR